MTMKYDVNIKYLSVQVDGDRESTARLKNTLSKFLMTSEEGKTAAKIDGVASPSCVLMTAPSVPLMFIALGLGFDFANLHLIGFWGFFKVAPPGGREERV